MDIKFSLILPVYNVEQYIARCIESILGQSYRSFEIIIVDDGSPDSSIKIAESFTDSRIKIVQKQNGGLSSAQNAGLKVATGSHVWFVDSDDAIAPDSLATIAAYIDQTTDMLVFNHVDRIEDEIIPSDNMREEVVLSGLEFLDKHHYLPVPVWCHVYSMEFLQRIGASFIEPIINEDFPFNLKAYTNAKVLKTIAGAKSHLYVYTSQRADSITLGGRKPKSINIESWIINLSQLNLYEDKLPPALYEHLFELRLLWFLRDLYNAKLSREELGTWFAMAVQKKVLPVTFLSGERWKRLYFRIVNKKPLVAVRVYPHLKYAIKIELEYNKIFKKDRDSK